jgi:hypothetical protein
MKRENWLTFFEETLVPATPPKKQKGGKKRFKLLSDAITGLTDKIPGIVTETVKTQVQPMLTELETKLKPAVVPALVDNKGEKVPVPSEIAVQLLQQKNQIEELVKNSKADREAATAAQKKAQEAERKMQIAAAVDQISFVNPEAKESFTRLFNMEVRQQEDGTLVGGPDNLPINVFVGEAAKRHDYFLSPEPVEGAGATRGQIIRGGGGTTLENIKPGMTKAEKDAAWADVHRVWRAAVTTQ